MGEARGDLSGSRPREEGEIHLQEPAVEGASQIAGNPLFDPRREEGTGEVGQILEDHQREDEHDDRDNYRLRIAL